MNLSKEEYALKMAALEDAETKTLNEKEPQLPKNPSSQAPLQKMRAKNRRMIFPDFDYINPITHKQEGSVGSIANRSQFAKSGNKSMANLADPFGTYQGSGGSPNKIFGKTSSIKNSSPSRSYYNKSHNSSGKKSKNYNLTDRGGLNFSPKGSLPKMAKMGGGLRNNGGFVNKPKKPIKVRNNFWD